MLDEIFIIKTTRTELVKEKFIELLVCNVNRSPSSMTLRIFFNANNIIKNKRLQILQHTSGACGQQCRNSC